MSIFQNFFFLSFKNFVILAIIFGLGLRRRRFGKGKGILGKAFDQPMFDTHRRDYAETGYRPTVFLDMLYRQTGVLTAKQLINAPRPSDGYTRHYEANRLDLTVEAIVIGNPRWHSLFIDNKLARARHLLKDYGYKG